MDEGDGLPRQAVALQPLTTADVGRLAELDRSESVGMLYAVRDGEIVPTGEGCEVPQWSGAWLDETVAFVRRHLESGGAGTAAFAGGELVGIVVLGGEPVRGDPHELQLAFLHVGRLYRRRGVAGRLFAEARAEAVRRGARRPVHLRDAVGERPELLPRAGRPARGPAGPGPARPRTRGRPPRARPRAGAVRETGGWPEGPPAASRTGAARPVYRRAAVPAQTSRRSPTER